MTGLLFVYYIFNGLSGYNSCKGEFGSFQGGLIELIVLTTTWVPGKEGERMEFKEKVWGPA
jgi:hypothetical protein